MEYNVAALNPNSGSVQVSVKISLVALFSSKTILSSERDNNVSAESL